MKKVISLVILFVSILFFSRTTFAADLNISCDDQICTPQTVAEFYSSSAIWAPGNTFSKSIAISNKGKKRFPIIVEASSPQTTGNLDMAIQFTIAGSTGSILWDGPLHAFYTYGPVQLSSGISKGETQIYTFTAYMYESADDQYQGKATTFNMTIGNYIYVSTTPVPCLSPKPAKPAWFNISKMSSTDVILYWGPVSTSHTGFTVSWGTDPNATNLGIKNLGKTYELLLSGLALDTRLHYFKVRAVNECVLGDYTSILSVGGVPTPTPKVASPTMVKVQSEAVSTATPPQTTTPSPTIATLSSATPLPSVTKSLIASDGAVLGAAVVKSNPADLIPLLVGVSTATIFIYWIYSMLFL